MVLALLDLGTQVLIMIIALVLLLEPKILLSQIQWGIAPTWEQFLYGLAIGTVAYTGIETISNMAEEAQHPDRDVPRSINFVIIAVLVVYIGMPLAALSAMKVGFNEVQVDPATGKTVPSRWSRARPRAPSCSSRDPRRPSTCRWSSCRTARWIIPQQEPTGPVQTIAGRARHQAARHPAGQQLRGRPGAGHGPLPAGQRRLAALDPRPVGRHPGRRRSSSSPPTPGIIGVSRLAFSLGQHRQLPRVLGRVHPTRLTPYVAIVVFGVIAVILILPGEITLLADLYAFGSMISFTAAHVSVIVLRCSEPDLRAAVPRPAQRAHRGASPCRMTAVFGAMGTFAVWCVIVYYKPLSGLIGIAWVAVGLVGYVIFRKAHGYSLTKTVKSPDAAGLAAGGRRVRPAPGARQRTRW